MRGHGIVLGLLLALAGCGLPGNVVVLTPDEDGKIGAASISNASGTVPLDQPFEAVGARSEKALAKPFVAEKAAVQREFNGVLSATPRAPAVFVIGFLAGQAVIDPGSVARVDEAIAKAKATADADISVVGHADRTGTDASNLELSLARAKAVRDRMVSGGVNPDIIDVGYHGANNPIVKTAAGVAEARNRRVEITIR